MTRENPTLAAREDVDVFPDVRYALDHRFSVPPEVQAEVRDGTVTLSGCVQWPFQRSEAEAAVKLVDGVYEVINSIVVEDLHGSAAA